jgi:proline iminopeptidase
MPINIQKALNTYKINKETEEYKFAKKMFYNQFVRGYKKSPLGIVKSRAGENNDIYNFMWGPEEFLLNGSLKNFDLSPKLPEITIPVLLLAGRFDEATPEAVKYFQKLLPNSEVVIFERSAHFPHLTERGRNIYTSYVHFFKKQI